MKRTIAVALTLTLGFADAQLLGSTAKISESAFCKKNDCQYIKLTSSGKNQVWTYYISRRLNFDVWRDTYPAKSVLYASRLRFVGGSINDKDAALISDYLQALSGVKISSGQVKACNNAKARLTLFRVNEGPEGYDFTTCHRVDSTEIVFESGTVAPG